MNWAFSFYLKGLWQDQSAAPGQLRLFLQQLGPAQAPAGQVWGSAAPLHTLT